MRQNPKKVLVIGATGSVGKHVVDTALVEGFLVRALVRSKHSGSQFASEAEVVVGDLTEADSLKAAVAGIDAVVFTHGTYGSVTAAEAVDYGAVRNVLTALGDKRVRIALMTTIGTTDRKGAHDWKRRGEWLVRASGHPYTIVRPAWFDCNAPDEHRLLMLQGDKALIGSPKDGVIARQQLAEVLVRSLVSEAALFKTFELHAVQGAAQSDIEPLFSLLDPDKKGSIHGLHDVQNMQLESEPTAVKDAIYRAQERAKSLPNNGASFDSR
jgi:uncharacterized protein YbjT (DUF2867 family)